jgi:hypothetical protein
MMWMNTSKVFPHNTPNITEYNLILLKQFYLTQQHKHYQNKIEQNFYQIQSNLRYKIHTRTITTTTCPNKPKRM